MQLVKCHTVGDCNVGKTCLVMTFETGTFKEEHNTGFHHFLTNLMYEGRPVSLALCDFPGQRDFDALRPLSYPESDVFLICFSLTNRASFENVQIKWYPEVNRHCLNAKTILVGTKFDLRETQGMVSREEGLSMAKSIGAVKYMECSSKTLYNLNLVFDEVVEATLRPGKVENDLGCCRSCRII